MPRLEIETDKPCGLDELLEELSESDTIDDERLTSSISSSSGR